MCTVRIFGVLNNQTFNQTGTFPRNSDGTVNAQFILSDGNPIELMNLPCPTTNTLSILVPDPDNDFQLNIEVMEG